MHMKSYEAVIIRLEILCIQRGMKASKLAYIAGVHPSTLKSIINGTSKNPGISTIKKLCDGLEITIHDFFTDVVFEGLEQEIE